jgi:hypothetical protein
MSTLLTPSQAVGAAAWRALHSFWLDVLSDQTPEVGRQILDAMGGDGRCDNWYAHVHSPQGVLRVLRYPAADPALDVYEVLVRTATAGDVPMVRVTGERLGLYDALLPDVEVFIADELITEWLDGDDVE